MDGLKSGWIKKRFELVLILYELSNFNSIII